MLIQYQILQSNISIVQLTVRRISNEITGVKWLKLDADTFYWTVPSANHPDTLKWDSGN